LKVGGVAEVEVALVAEEPPVEEVQVIADQAGLLKEKLCKIYTTV